MIRAVRDAFMHEHVATERQSGSELARLKFGGLQWCMDGNFKLLPRYSSKSSKMLFQHRHNRRLRR